MPNVKQISTAAFRRGLTALLKIARENPEELMEQPTPQPYGPLTAAERGRIAELWPRHRSVRVVAAIVRRAEPTVAEALAKAGLREKRAARDYAQNTESAGELSPEELRRRCLEIQSEWDERTELSRRAVNNPEAMAFALSLAEREPQSSVGCFLGQKGQGP